MQLFKANLLNTTLAALLAIVTSGAQADTLVPNTAVQLFGTDLASEPQLAGAVLVDQYVSFSYASKNGTTTGKVQQRVVRSSVDNTIDFYWRIFNDRNSNDGIGAFRLGDFVAPEYNANWRTDGLGDVSPNSAYQFTDNSFINFNFGEGLSPGLSSKFFFFDTTATDYAKTALFDIAFNSSGNNGFSAAIATYSPVQAPSNVPLPAAAWLMFSGLTGLGAVKKFKPAASA